MTWWVYVAKKVEFPAELAARLYTASEELYPLASKHGLRDSTQCKKVKLSRGIKLILKCFWTVSCIHSGNSTLGDRI